MNEQEVIRLLQYYRHDLMNELQIIHGYLSLDNIDKVKSKVDEVIVKYNEERKLMDTKAIYFTLWILQINQKQSNVKLTYQLDFDQLNLKSLDEELVDYCSYIINGIQMHGNKHEIYGIDLILTEAINSSGVYLKWIIKGDLLEVDYFKKSLNGHPVSFEEKENHYLIECFFDIEEVR